MGVESGFGALIVEMGVLGPSLWLAWTGSLLLACWRAVRRVERTAHFPLGFSHFLFPFFSPPCLPFWGRGPNHKFPPQPFPRAPFRPLLRPAPPGTPIS